MFKVIGKRKRTRSPEEDERGTRANPKRLAVETAPDPDVARKKAILANKGMNPDWYDLLSTPERQLDAVEVERRRWVKSALLLIDQAPEIEHNVLEELVRVWDPKYITTVDYAQVPKPFKSDKVFYTTWWRHTDFIFPGESCSGGGGIIEGRAEEFVENVYAPVPTGGRPRIGVPSCIHFEIMLVWDMVPSKVFVHPAEKPQSWPKLVHANIQSLYWFYEVLGGRRERLNLRLVWKRDENMHYPTPDTKRSLGPAMKEMSWHIEKILESSLDLYAQFVQGVVGYDRFMDPMIAASTVLSDPVKRDLVRGNLADQAKDQIERLWNQKRVNTGFMKWWMMDAFKVPEAVRIRDYDVRQWQQPSVPAYDLGVFAP